MSGINPKGKKKILLKRRTSSSHKRWFGRRQGVPGLPLDPGGSLTSPSYNWVALSRLFEASLSFPTKSCNCSMLQLKLISGWDRESVFSTFKVTKYAGLYILWSWLVFIWYSKRQETSVIWGRDLPILPSRLSREFLLFWYSVQNSSIRSLSNLQSSR